MKESIKEWLKAFTKAIGTFLLILIIIGLIIVSVILLGLLLGIIIYTVVKAVSGPFIYIVNKFGILRVFFILLSVYLIGLLTREFHDMAIIDKRIADKDKYERARDNMLANSFLTPWTCQNRDMVRNEKSKGKEYSIDSFKSYIGHIYDDTGRYQTFYLQPGIDNIARFICCNNQDKFLTSDADEPVLTAIGKFLDLGCIPEMEKDKLITLLSRYRTKNTRFEYEKE